MDAHEALTPQQPARWLVEIEVKRIQTYLFAVPRLPVMIGANALMGETLRGLWLGDGFDNKIPSLPALAQQSGARWLDGQSAAVSSGQTAAADPLTVKGTWQDDVTAVAEKTGVLTRDAGHFEALFPGDDQGRTKRDEFLARAWELFQQRLPGIHLSARVSAIRWDNENQIHCQDKAEPAVPAASGMAVLDLAQAEVCEFSGEEPASERLAVTAEEKPLVSQSVANRYRHGREFDKGATQDILGILRPILLQDLGFDATDARAFPSDFSQLATKGYLAVIHVDGNSVGSRSRAYKSLDKSEDFFAQWRRRESFYHALRVGVRIAVRQALREVFRGWRTHNHQAPLRLLMLGGDDLALVCGAGFGLRFVEKLARRVKEITKDLPGGEVNLPGPLTLGAGVAIVQDSFPFHRAYELAENLAESAKRLKSALPAKEGNVVDWIVTSEAWHGDIEATRRDQSVIDGHLILSSKPYRILKSEPRGGEKSLEEMLVDVGQLAKQTRQDRVARGQLQALARSLPRGRHTARFAAEVLPKNLYEALSEMHYLSRDEGPWTPLQSSRRFKSRLLDLLELYELEILHQEAIQTGHLFEVEPRAAKKNHE